MTHEKNLHKRQDTDQLQRQAALFSSELLTVLLDSVNNSVVILNTCRQVVYANKTILELLEADSLQDILGLRPGEIFDCAHALESPGGCGTTEYCRQCGAMRATLRGLDGIENEDECRIIRHKGVDLEAYDLRVKATPFHTGDEDFVIISFNDVSHEKRRRALERIFFHDILNTAGGLRGLVEVLAHEVPPSLKQDASLLYKFLDMLLDEIKAHKLLLAAESDELQIKVQPLRSLLVLESVLSVFSGHEAAEGRQLCLEQQSEGVSFQSDVTLLRRVLVNLVKNALEASAPGQTVTTSCSKNEKGGPVFSVHNPGFMERDVQLQVFKRSFSTKGEGRGLGTYSVKLLTERYLGGAVGFSSSREKGTIFTVSLPLAPAEAVSGSFLERQFIS